MNSHSVLKDNVDFYNPAHEQKTEIKKFRIKRDVLENLEGLHRLAAEQAIRSGKWILVENVRGA
ncbi:hypothetical protein [Methanogenium cariaci]